MALTPSKPLLAQRRYIVRLKRAIENDHYPERWKESIVSVLEQLELLLIEDIRRHNIEKMDVGQ